ncbi:MAG: aspartate racemase [Gammaproteobacteria bacterium]|jgi:aspartate racemase
MKTIGLIGGMSWESTVVYYRQLNQQIKQQLGGHHSARIILNSLDFSQIEDLQHRGKWDETADVIIKAAQSLEAAGADFFLIGTNTMHIVADRVAESVGIPLLNIIDATAEVLNNHGAKRVGLLGTAFTMEMDFYADRLRQQNIEVVVPELHDRQMVHDIIYQELCLGQFDDESKVIYKSVIERFPEIDGVILGCTEIGMLINQQDTDIKLFDTTYIHVDKAIQQALAD